MTTSTIFTTKDEYLAFRAAWANYVNSPEAKPTLTPKEFEHWLDETGKLTSMWSRKCTVTKIPGLERCKGCVTANHVALYNVLRGKPIERGFDLKYPDTISDVKKYVNRVIELAVEYKTGIPQYRLDYLQLQIKFYNGTVTLDHIAALQVQP